MELICAVCSAEAPHRCASCSSVAYCSLEHQKQHWKIHRKNCSYFKIVDEPKLGKGFVATRDIQAGTIILEELPVAVAPFGRTACLTCGLIDDTLSTVRRCSRCNWPVCSLECENLPLHSVDCQLFALLNVDYERFRNYYHEDVFRDIVMAYRFCMLKAKDPWKYQQVLELCCEFQLPNDETDSETAKALECLELSLIAYKGLEFPSAEISKLINIFRINCFTDWRRDRQTRFDRIVHARTTSMLYLKSSRMNHSCIPNCDWDVSSRPEFKIRFRTTRAVKKGEALTHFYFEKHIHKATDLRQRSLRKDGYFLCECVRCKDPTELGSYLSGVICEACRPNKTPTSGYFLPEDPVNLSADAKWKCNRCGDVKLAKDVLQKIEEFAQKLSMMENKFGLMPHDDRLIVFCKELINKTSGITLHPNHWIIHQAMTVSGRFLLDHRKTTISIAWNEYLLKIWRHLLSILDLLNPGLTILRAEAQFQLASTLCLQHVALLKQKNYKQVERNHEESIALLKEALQYCKNEFSRIEGLGLNSQIIQECLSHVSRALIVLRLDQLKISSLKK